MTTETSAIIPGLARLWRSLDALTYLLLRVAVGAFLIPHGVFRVVNGGLEGTARFMSKVGLEPAYFLACYVTTLEIVGGICILFGLLTRPVALLVAGFMAVGFVIHLKTFGYFWTAQGAEMPLMWFTVALVLLIKGPGPMSLDRLIGREF